MHSPKISVIIVSYNVRYFLELCLHAVYRSLEGIEAEVIVVDNLSADDSCAMVRAKFPQTNLIANVENVGFSRANNQGVAISQGDYIHFLNPDTVIPEDFYQKSLAFLDQHPEAGSVGPRIIDGRGNYSPDSKKSFPSFWPSLYKVTGLARVFKKSPVLNRYYAAHIDEWETAPTDILSGCCLIVRKSAMEAAGGSFDEAYFMYCEDFDLCHRLTLAGYKNYYFPETTIIHYKGESTRKLTFRYVRIFNDALALFVRKYYPKRLGSSYIFMLKVVMALRTVFNWAKHLFSVFKLFIVDAALLAVVMVCSKLFWLERVVPDVTVEAQVFLTTAPLFVLVWLLSLFLNGAYDKPYSLFRAGRGMLLGTVIVLAFYGLLPLEYRYSRGIILVSGMAGTAVLLVSRWLFSLLRFIKLVPRGQSDYRAAIVGNTEEYRQTNRILRKIKYTREVVGRIATDQNTNSANIGDIADIKAVQQTYRINELIFSSGSVSYATIIEQMQRIGEQSFYKIQIPGSDSIVGSNSAQQNADEYLWLKKYAIAGAAARRNKRILDLAVAVALILVSPVLILRKDSGTIVSAAVAVLRGKKTWVGYDKNKGDMNHLPDLKPAIFPPFILLSNYTPPMHSYEVLAERYASEYTALEDLRLILNNLRFTGKKI
jgi:GT2 family glycosyltransferase